MNEAVSMYNKNNPYGFRLNVNHPEVRPYYERYKAKIGATIISDEQRREFEGYMIPFLEKKARQEATGQ